MDHELETLKGILKQRGLFATRPRLQLFSALQTHSEQSTRELINALPSQDQATVYRNLLMFEDLGIIKRLGYGWKAKFELSELFRKHHHHATCINCGKTIVLHEDEATERLISDLAERNNFRITNHALEIQGLCAVCQKSVDISN